MVEQEQQLPAHIVALLDEYRDSVQTLTVEVVVTRRDVRMLRDQNVALLKELSQVKARLSEYEDDTDVHLKSNGHTDGEHGHDHGHDLVQVKSSPPEAEDEQDKGSASG